MIEAIKELNFPSYATLTKATVAINDMGDRTITSEIKIDGDVAPDFSYDWEVEFKGEKYIQPLRKPQALKDNNSINSTINLTFYHWAIYQLKRDYFVELASTQAGTAFADKYISPLAVDLGEFIIAFNNVLSYYFPDGKIYAELNPNWEYNAEKQYVEINYSYLWDVLQKTYDLFETRWTIERDSQGNYAIRFGYPAGELTHVFEYGFDGGLLKVERQVQSANIRNKILGRGGSQNIPYLYFKDFDKYPQGNTDNQGMMPDPDAIPELSNIYFSELRDSNFRSYVQGWKTNPNRMLVTGDSPDDFNAARAESDYAYMRGATDKKFDPVEFVKDDASIAEYGELVGKLENNEEIYPSLQGMEIEITSPSGAIFNTRADEIVAVQEVVTDLLASDDEDSYKNDINQEMKSSTSYDAGKNTLTATAATISVSSNEIEVPDGYEGTLFDLPIVKYTLEFKERIKQYMQYKQYHEGDKVSAYTYQKGDSSYPTISYKVMDVISNKEVHPVNLPEGRYRIDYTLKFPAITLPTGIIHAQQTPSGLGQTERVSIYWLKRIVTTSATMVCKSFNGDVILNKVDGVSISKSVSVEAHSKATISISGDSFSVPDQGAIMVDVPISVTPASTTTYSEKTVKVIDTSTNEIVPASNIPKGDYRLLVEVTLTNDATSKKTLTVELLPAYLYFVDNTAKWEPTFDVWIKNIFNTKKSAYASEAAYVEGVWSPLRTEDEMAVTFSTGNLSGHDNWEFRIKKDGIAYDNSKVIVDENGNEVRSEWRLTLIKSDAELETIKKYVPYKNFNATAGDKFFFTGIYLPHQYILSAEQKLTRYKEDNLREVKDIKPQWVVSIDKVRAQQGDVAGKLIDDLSVGSVITLKDKRFLKAGSELQTLQSITYEWQEGYLLPNVSVVLSDKVTTTLSTVAMLQGKVESLIKQAKSVSDIELIVRKLGDLLYLRKDGFEDTSYSPTKFADTVSSDDFNPGAVGGFGWGIYQDENGHSVIEADKLFIRNEMQVNSLVVNQIAALGGTKILSAADMTISSVEPVVLANNTVGERCFFDTRGASKANLFAINDIAYSNMFDSRNAELKYYKRRVLEVGENYITLSTAESDGSGTPQEGDVIVHFGNFTDKSRQSFIIINPLNGGKIEVFSGVNSFDVSERNMIGFGVDPKTNESFLYGYGDMFFGERGGSGHFISFDKSTGKFNIKADVTFESGSSGLENLPEWVKVKDTAEQALEKAEAVGENTIKELEAYIEEVRDDLQGQIDGAIDSFFYDYEPSISNFPASEWDTTAEKEAHLNDTFTNLTDGRSWRWSKSGATYTWVEIADTATSEALALAGKAQKTADGKMKTFLQQPTPPYNEGDLWAGGKDIPLMRCINTKKSGSYDASDWQLADNSQSYTDNAIKNTKVGGQNLLRNSGFTGDYLSEQLSDEAVLDAAAQLYSSPFDHWTHTNATVADSSEVISGKAVVLSSGEISQGLYYKTVFGAQYVLSFKAKGSGNLSYTIGNASGSVELADTWKEFEIVVTIKAQSNAFRLSGSNCTLGNLKLEKGNKSTAWSPSPLDNSSDRAYYQSLKYLQSALAGVTDVNGGLVLTEQIQVGDYDKETKEWVKMSGGMSGIYEDDTDVAFWAGGNLEKAITAVSKYENDPTYQPTEEELAIMAKFVVTHGGRAILEDAIVRGTIYARDGKFKGEVIANGGKIGDFDISQVDGGVFLRSEGDRGNNESAMMTLSGYGLQLHAEGGKGDSGEPAYRSQATCYPTRQYASIVRNSFTDTSSDDSTHPTECIALRVRADGAKINDNRQSGGNYAIYNEYGMIGGLRPRVIAINDTSITLSSIDHTVLVVSACNIILPSSPQNGQEYEIICPNTSLGVVTIASATKKIYLMLDGVERNSFGVGDLGGTRQVVKLVYFERDEKWFGWHHVY